MPIALKMSPLSLLILCSNYENIVEDIIFLTDGYTTDEIKLNWKNDNPVQVNEELELPQFDLNKWEVSDCETSYVTGRYK